MPKLHLDWSDGRYYTRPLSDEEAAAAEAAGSTIVYLEDHVYAAYERDCERDSIWQVFWRSVANEHSMRRREKELMPLEDADREIARLKDELERSKRSASFFEDEWSRLRAAQDLPKPPPSATHQEAQRAAAWEAWKMAQHMYQNWHSENAESKFDDWWARRSWSSAQEPQHMADEFTCIYPQPGCQIEALRPEWQERAQEILAKYHADHMEGGLKYQGCCCGHQHELLDDVEADRLRGAGFLVENDSESYTE